MKNKLVLALGILLVFGFVSCATSSTNISTAPLLTDFITVTHEDGVAHNWNSITSFPKGHGVNVGIKGSDADKDIEKFVFTFYSDGIKGSSLEKNVSINGENFTQFLGSFITNTPGTNFAVEVYAVDAKGNQSNSLTANFAITES
jgi:hypothetical protein